MNHDRSEDLQHGRLEGSAPAGPDLLAARLASGAGLATALAESDLWATPQIIFANPEIISAHDAAHNKFSFLWLGHSVSPSVVLAASISSRIPD